MPYQLAILKLSGFNATGAKWSQQDALGYAADGGVSTLQLHQMCYCWPLMGCPPARQQLQQAPGLLSICCSTVLLQGSPAGSYAWHNNIWPIRSAENC